MNDTVILAARRTPIGAFQGMFASVAAPQLGAAAARAAVADSGVPADAVDEVIFGCVLPAGLGQAPARQAAIAAGVAPSVPATTVNKMCGSGMKAVMIGADQIRAGSAGFVLAGGLESMTNAPYLLLKARGGYRMGHGEILDHMFYDGLQSPWDGQAMGCFAENTADKYGFTRAQQDAFAAESVRRAQRAVRDAPTRPRTYPGRHARNRTWRR
jgi:acetyl-CoA C-acetyltransferase